MIDYHIHTTYSDGASKIEEYQKTAEKKGIREIAFTEHLILNNNESGLDIKNIPKIFEEAEEFRQTSSVKIKIGLEIDYFERYEKEIEKIIEEYPFDFNLVSVHFINGEIVNSHSLMKRYDQIELYKKYFSLLEQAVESQLFKVIAHFDYIRRYSEPFYKNRIPIEEYKNLIERIIQLAADHKSGVEVNTSGLRHPINDTYPNIEILRMCKEIGVKIVTIGSDSHSVSDLGDGLEFGVERLKEVGYSEIATFEKGKPKLVRIEEI